MARVIPMKVRSTVTLTTEHNLDRILETTVGQVLVYITGASLSD
jgi:hypothetical protein